ncbi:MAG: protein kinase family protein [Cyanobacteria bacterium P01_F01_bin.150]
MLEVIDIDDDDSPSMVMRLMRGSERIRLLEDIVVGLRIISRSSNHLFCPEILDTFVWNFNDSKESAYCVLTEKVEGLTLEEYVDHHGANDDQVIAWMKQLFEMLDTFHGQSWLLRDIKPENFVINAEGRLIFVDIPSLLHWPWDEDSPFVHLSSPGYSAPEQNDSRPVSASDVFSIGRTAISCLTGRSPIDLYEEDGFRWRHLLKDRSPLLLDFIEQLVSLSPIDRPTVKESIHYLSILPEKIRKAARWKQYKWPLTIALSVTVLGVAIPLEKRLSSWSSRIRADQEQLAGNVEYAHRLYERSLRANSKNAFAYLGLGMTCSEKGCGIEYLEQALELSPEDDVILYNLAVLYESVEPQRALELYGAIPAEANRYALAQNNMARVEIEQGNATQALVILDSLIEQGRQDNVNANLLSKAHKNKGWAYIQVGNYEGAQASLEQSVVLNPLIGDAYCLLAYIDPNPADLVSCFSLDSQSPESKDIKAQLFSQYLILDNGNPL